MSDGEKAANMCVPQGRNARVYFRCTKAGDEDWGVEYPDPPTGERSVWLRTRRRGQHLLPQHRDTSRSGGTNASTGTMTIIRYPDEGTQTAKGFKIGCTREAVVVQKTILLE